MKHWYRFLLLALAVACMGCSTHARFVVPEGSKLYLDGRPGPEVIRSDGLVKTRPFGWDAIGVPPVKGIPYRLEKDGQTIKEGRLRNVFRGASIFWPPVFGIIAWPTGLNRHIKYDLVNDRQERAGATVAVADE